MTVIFLFHKLFSNPASAKVSYLFLKLSLLQRKHSESGYMVMRIEESSGNSILLACKERDLFAATFTQMLIGNLGKTLKPKKI